MENAGRAIAEAVLEFRPTRVLVLAGTGNNGGDGLVAARHLLASGVRTRACLLGKPSDVRTYEAKANLQILQRLSPRIVFSFRSKDDLKLLERELRRSDVVVDSIIGTGIKGKIREPMASIIRLVNSSGKPVVAVDVPTGVDPATGRVAGVAIRATVTVALHAAKRGVLKAKRYTGRIKIASIGIPEKLL